MQLYSINQCIILLFSFAFFARGGPIPGAASELQAHEGSQTQIPLQPQDNMDQFPEESMLQRFAWVACAYRMAHPNFADEEWGGKYVPMPPSTTDPNFASFVIGCVPRVLQHVRPMADEVKSLPQEERGAKFVNKLCSYRCNDKDGLEFEGIQFTGQWPPAPDPHGAADKCTDKCKVIYESLLGRVKRPWDELEEKEQALHAIGVVEENDKQLKDKERAKRPIKIRILPPGSKSGVRKLDSGTNSGVRKSPKNPTAKALRQLAHFNNYYGPGQW